MATISDGVTTITPTVRLNAADSYASRNIVHELLGGGVAITFGGEPKRTGSLDLFFNSETDANTAYQFLKNGYVFQLADTVASTTDMNFVIAGNISRAWDGSTLNSWLVSFDFQEVQP